MAFAGLLGAVVRRRRPAAIQHEYYDESSWYLRQPTGLHHQRVRPLFTLFVGISRLYDSTAPAPVVTRAEPLSMSTREITEQGRVGGSVDW